ncbi:MAG: hypothetical protein QM759_09600 [Terricaulis sp.]
MSYKSSLQWAAFAALGLIVIAPLAASADPYVNEAHVTVIGAIHDRAGTSRAVDPRDAALPAMPVVYEAAAPGASQDHADAAQSAEASRAQPAQTSATRPGSDLGHVIEQQ